MPEPKRIDGYEIVRPVGAGAMGQVYEAIDPTANRRVAIKVMRSGARASAHELERFRRERQGLARIRHPHVLRVHAAGSWRGRLYLVTELLSGRTLNDALGGPLPLETAKRYALQIASGLGALHAAGLIHRDVKPENVFFDEAGRLKVADLGLVVALDDETLTKTGTMLGTPTYMAPEAFGQLVRSPATDVYSLGVILYEMLTGSLPHSATHLMGMALARRNDPAPDPRRIAPGVPASVAEVCQKAMALEPEDRYPDATGFAEALRGADSVRRGWKLGAALAACCSLLMVGGLWFSRAGGEAETQPAPRGVSAPPRPGGEGSEAPADSGPTLAARPLTLEEAAGTRMTDGLPLTYGGMAWSERGLWVAGVTELNLFPDAPDLGRSTRFGYPDQYRGSHFAWHLDASRLAVSGGTERGSLLELFHLDEVGSPRAVVVPELVQCMAWSRGGSLLLGTSRGGIFELEPGEETPALRFRLQSPVVALASAEGGSILYYAHVDVALGRASAYRFGVFPGSEPVQAPPMQYKPLVVLERRGLIYVGTSGHEVFRRSPSDSRPFAFKREGARPRNADLGERVLRLSGGLSPSHDGPVSGLALSRDGSTLVSIARVGESKGGELHAWDDATGALLERALLRGSPTAVVCSPNGRHVAVVTRERDLRLFTVR